MRNSTEEHEGTLQGAYIITSQYKAVVPSLPDGKHNLGYVL